MLFRSELVEIEVDHRYRKFGQTKYGFNRSLKFLLDVALARTYFVILRKPLYFFGILFLSTMFASFLMFTGAIILKVIGYKKYFDGSLIIGSLILSNLSSILLSLGLIAESQNRYYSILNHDSQYLIRDFKNY